MLKTLFTSLALMLSVVTISAQEIKEPDFELQLCYINADNSITVLKEEKGQMKSKSTAYGFIPIVGSGLLDKSRFYYYFDGPTSPNVLPIGKHRFIVRVEDNAKNPKKLFGFFVLEKKKKKRRGLAMEFGRFEWDTNTKEAIDYEAKKYGEKSYIIEVNFDKPGDYYFANDTNTATIHSATLHIE